jgi:1-phosphofructokinase family hexose kinase
VTIATVTPNPALDVTYTVDELEVGAENRVTGVVSRPGGKGVNTANVLRYLGSDVLVLGLVGGRAGLELRSQLADRGVREALTPIAGDTRRTVAVVDARSGRTTLLNEPGPVVSGAEWHSLLESVTRAGATARVVTMSGSLPRGAGVDAYAQLVVAARAGGGLGIPVIVDTSGPALAAACVAEPDLVKPNTAELAAAFPDLPDPAARAGELLRLGARAVAVSAGSEGLRVLTPRFTVRGRLPRVLEGNATGAGDAALAAFAWGLAIVDDPAAVWADRAGVVELLRRAVAVSAAAVLAPVAGEVDPDDVSMLMKEVDTSDR